MLSPPPISRTRTRLVLTRIPDSWAWVRTDLLIRLLPFAARSEEHTSELQSQSNLVCRLLLEKKKKDVGILTLNQQIEHHHIRLDHLHGNHQYHADQLRQLRSLELPFVVQPNH